MSTTDLRDQLVRAIYDAIPDDDPRDPKPPLAEHVALPWIERDVDAVLAVVAPLIAREKAEALRCAAWDWSDWDALESPEAWLRARADQIEQEADQ